jgi:uncharacterized membrane protein YfcA
MVADPLAVEASPVTVVLLAAAAFAAGLVDAIAGGGGLVTVPALLAAGLPPHVALATNKGQAVFGAVASAAGYARKGAIERARAPLAFALGCVGSLLGAAGQLAMRPSALRPAVLVLLVASAVVVSWPRPSGARVPLAYAPLLGAAAALFLGAYDGFFGPGVGTMLLVSFVLVYGDSLTRASANAKVVNLASNVAAFLLFTWRGNIVWPIAVAMGCANLTGAWVGAHLAVARGDRFIRPVVLVVVAALVLKLAIDLRGP